MIQLDNIKLELPALKATLMEVGDSLLNVIDIIWVV